MPHVLRIALATFCHRAIDVAALRATVVGRAPSQVVEAMSGSAQSAGEAGASLLQGSSSHQAAWHGFSTATHLAMVGLRNQPPGSHLSMAPAPHAVGSARSARATQLGAAAFPEEQPARSVWPKSIEAKEGVLAKVAVKANQGMTYDVLLPVGWVDHLLTRSVTLVGVCWSQHFEMNWASSCYKGKVLGAPVPVGFRIMSKEDSRATRMQHIVNRLESMQSAGLASGNHLVPIYDQQVDDDTVFWMFPYGQCTLRELLNKQLAWSPRGTLLPLKRSLPILIDMLRGLKNLQSAGIVLGDLTEASVHIWRGRAFLGGYDTGCIAHNGDRRFSCSRWDENRDGWIGSACRHAPEMFDGLPTGASNSVWAVGLIFAEIALGYKPTELPGPKTEEYDADDEGRRSIRELIREHFFITRVEGFDKLLPCVQELLAGMLAKSPADRWTAAEALEKAQAVAESFDIEVPEEMALPGNHGFVETW